MGLSITKRSCCSWGSSLLLLALAFRPTVVWAQAVCLPSPRLLTTMPMGGEVGTEVEVKITGEYLEEAGELLFSHPGIVATPQVDTEGARVPNVYRVTIAEDCPVGLHDARVMTSMGISSARAFRVDTLEEVKQEKPSTTPESAMPLAINSVCNAALPVRGVNHYAFEAKQGQRLVVRCAAKGIDSKANPVLIVADETGADLVVERLSGVLEFTAPADGSYLIKVHELTFQGGPEYFYRLSIADATEEETPAPMVSTRAVNAFSWPPVGLASTAAMRESIADEQQPEVREIELPCDIAGRFFPAADIDVYEFDAQAGEVWWVEVASERLGLPTDPSIVIQRVEGNGAEEVLTDVVEMTDIPSPIKVSSNGYAYDGPPYNTGTSDILGKLEIKEEGRYRLQLTDLFGGTRNAPQNAYRLVIRQAQPDFALVAWAMHMQLRNGDRNALSKPIAVRPGGTMALEVVAFRRDGFDGPIELDMTGLPEGVTAEGLDIPAGKSHGTLLITATEDAPTGLSQADFVGRAEIEGRVVTRPCQLASMAWPVKDAWREIPRPRLVADFPVSVSGAEVAPITIAPQGDDILEVNAGETVTIPLVHRRRSEFSGATFRVKALGAGFERVGTLELPLTKDTSEAVLDLKTLKTPPGDYQLAFFGSAVVKYQANPAAVLQAEMVHKEAQQAAAAAAAEAKQAAEQAAAASEAEKAALAERARVAAEKKKAADAAVVQAASALKRAKDQAKPKDIADIVVTEPIALRVKPAE